MFPEVLGRRICHPAIFHERGIGKNRIDHDIIQTSHCLFFLSYPNFGKYQSKTEHTI
jgi:hypothetical protein